MENYYLSPNRYIPSVVESHMESLIIYVAAILFPDEFIKDPQQAYNKIIISDVNAGSNVGLGDAIQWFQTMSNYFPFVIYAPGMSSLPNDYGNTTPQNLGVTFIEELNAYVRTYPMTMEVQFVAFFSDSLDHRRAITLMAAEGTKITKLYTPMLFDNTEVNLPITLTFQFEKGDLTSEFETHLAQGRIWSFQFTIVFRYHEYLFEEILTPDLPTIYDNTGVLKKPPIIQKVDDILMRLYGQISNNRDESILLKSIPSPETPTIQSTSPASSAKDVPLNSEISIVFSKPIQPSTAINIIINPYIEKEIYFNTSSTIVNIDPISASGLSQNTTYSVIIPTSVKDIDGLSLEKEYKFSFKTGLY